MQCGWEAARRWKVEMRWKAAARRQTKLFLVYKGHKFAEDGLLYRVMPDLDVTHGLQA